MKTAEALKQNNYQHILKEYTQSMEAVEKEKTPLNLAAWEQANIKFMKAEAREQVIQSAIRQGKEDVDVFFEDKESISLEKTKPSLAEAFKKMKDDIQVFRGKRPILFKALVATAAITSLISVISLCISVPPLGFTLLGLGLALAIKVGIQMYQSNKVIQEARKNREVEVIEMENLEHGEEASLDNHQPTT